jgi:hypothetical protein
MKLPTEVWRIISSQMSIREWVRVSGTCKTMWQLALEDVQLDWWAGAAGELHSLLVSV